MSETLPSLTANGQKIIDRLLTLPQGWVTAAMLAEHQREPPHGAA